MSKLEELKAKATELEITYEDEITEEDLASKISEVEKEKNEKDPDYLRKEADKAFKARDAAKRDKRASDAEIKKLKEKMASTVSKDDYEDLKAQLTELREREIAREEAEEEEKLSKASESEKAKILADKEKDRLRQEYEVKLKQKEKEFEKQMEEAKKLVEMNQALRKRTLESEIIIAAEKNNALKPQQIVRLLKDDFEWDDTLGKYVYEEKDSKGKLVDYHDVESYVAEFLGREENDNLVKSDINANTFSSSRGDTSTTTTTTKKGDYKPTGKYDPKNPQLLQEARKEGMPVEKWIRIKEMRDKRLKEKEERLEKSK